MDLNELQRNWDILGREDPLWAIITTPEKRGNKWDVAEFFASGEREIDEVLKYVGSLKIAPPCGHALDFGCGVGRLTRALAIHFKSVTGVDIAPSMIDRARALDSQLHCKFVLNDRADLAIFRDNTFDFVYSNIVLQHMKPDYSTAYIREFFRVLAPGGVAVFQVPTKYKPVSKPSSWKDSVRPFIPAPVLRWYRRGRPPIRSKPASATRPQPSPTPSTTARMEMYTVPKRHVRRVIKAAGCCLVDTVRDGASGPGYESWRYCVVKRHPER